MIHRFLMILLTTVFYTVNYSFAEMSSANYSLSTSVMDTSGSTKSSYGYNLLDSVGQPTPIGYSGGSNFKLEAGFLYGTRFSMPLDQTISNVIPALQGLLTDPSLSKQQKKDIQMALKFLEDALNSYALYKAGDTTALANALNKTRSAIDKLIASGVETGIYQEMLAQSAELGVTAEINRIASIAGDNNPYVIQARYFLSNGSTELLSAVYDRAVQSFTQAYNEALLAV
ncbi:MAG: hypothetical protein HY097_10395 [Nitrospinae bacterium]|nr:hypothetical protein [Nitrospinota bacterium]